MVMVMSALPGLNNYMRLSSQSVNRVQSTFNETQQAGSKAMVGLDESSTNSQAAQKRLETYAAQNAGKATNSVNTATQAISTVSLGNNRTEMRAETAVREGIAALNLSLPSFDTARADKMLAFQTALSRRASLQQSTTAETNTTGGNQTATVVAQSASLGAASNQIASMSQQAMTTVSNEKTQTGQSTLQIQRNSAALNVYNQISTGQSRAGINAQPDSTASQGGTGTVDPVRTTQRVQQMGISTLSMSNQVQQPVLNLMK